MHELPPEMPRGRRPADQEFGPSERLFRRVHPDHFIPGHSRIDLAAFELPDMSVNREKHGGKAEYVLCNVYPGSDGKCDERHHPWGIVSFSVDHVSRTIENAADPAAYSTRPQHAPENHNFFHTEIRAFDTNGNHISFSNADRLGKKAYDQWRRIVRAGSTVVRRPASE
jgi:hypothetical protein